MPPLRLIRAAAMTHVMIASAVLALAACSDDARPTAGNGAAPPTDGEMGEPHDQSSFGRDPAERHLMSPDEPDLHPEPGPTGEASR